MKKIIFILLIFFGLNQMVFSQHIQKNLPLISNWDNDSLKLLNGWITFNDIWGYVDFGGKEYAILGTVTGTYFVDISTSNPRVVAFFAGKDSIGVNRDFKTYGHYAYGVCDQGNSSLQIFDLGGLPATVTKVYDSDSLSTRCHTIFIEKDRLYIHRMISLLGRIR